ncbi:MAG: cell surface protein SprA [Vicingaceae bacterium]
MNLLTFSSLLRRLRRCPSGGVLIVLLWFTLSQSVQAQGTDVNEDDSTETELLFPFKDNSNEGRPGGTQNGMYLKEPSNIKGQFVYDPTTDSYIYVQKMGDMDYRSPASMSLEEYLEYDLKKNEREFFREKSREVDKSTGAGFRPKLYVEGKAFDRIFGGNTIDIRPQGSAEVSFGLNTTRRDNPAIPENQRRTTNFDFDEKIQLNVVGSIGDKLKISTSYNTEATFDFENQTKIEYTGYEDEIIQKIELGNVALPLRSSLIQGSQTLFGVKTELKFGRMRVTSIFSQEKGERKEVNVSGGSQTSDFELSASDYEDNQHYFLGHYFRDRYNRALSDLPNVISAFRIIKAEVWVTQAGGQIENARNVIAFTDLGESRRDVTRTGPPFRATGRDIADNFESNNLYTILTSTDASPLTSSQQQTIRGFSGAKDVLENTLGMVPARDFEAFEGVRLNQTEFNLNEQLGYISLNRKMDPQDILGVAYEYILNDRTYRVGELSNNAGEIQDAIYVKLLKSTLTNTDIPLWDLMMKNVYYLNAFGISREDFRFEIWYLDSDVGVELPFIAEGPIKNQLLIQVTELDNLDYYNAKQEDGEFDYVEGITIRPDKGRVYFPVVEPFGSHLRKRLVDPDLGDKYAFDSLYSTIKALAELDANKNRFYIKGSYKSSSGSEIRLNSFNIPQGSVVVTAGGVRLTENVDYSVNYSFGTVTILNQGLLNSNTPIKVSLESNSLFNIQTKTLLGTRVDYDIDENTKVGGTVLNLTERPLTNKVNIGDEAISNTIVGVDGSYSMEAPILTKIADALPLFDTKEKSRVNTTAEFAYLIPGNSRAITKEGVAYIDDFEGSQSQIDVKQVFNWRLASTPRGQPQEFPETQGPGNNTRYGFNRAKLAWYVIDPLFFNPDDARLPDNITPEMQANAYTKEVQQNDIFPLKSFDQTLIGNIPVLDLAYYPKERGQYNFDTPLGEPGISDGLESDGSLRNPQSRWGGLMRDMTTTDFEESNIEFLQFWVLDPFIDQDYSDVFGGVQPPTGGDLYFNFGEVSEDILRDDRKSYENGFPYPGNDSPIDSTAWGRVPTNKVIVNAFDNLPEARPFQDIGLDGLNDQDEATFHSDFVTSIQGLDPTAVQQILQDPAADNFRYFRDASDSRNENIAQRYKDYNGLEGNSPVSTGDFAASSTTLPDIEDINRDNTSSSNEAYYQYRIPVNRGVFTPSNVGNDYITNVVETPEGHNWYQFKIPLRNPDQVIGEIKDFKAIRFMRMYMKGFDAPVILRFARMDLIRGEWRRYFGDLREDGEYIQGEEDDTRFELNAVNIEENSSREPVNYVLPPGIEREIDFGTSNLQQLNEQSLSLRACELNDGSSRAAFRNMGLDIRQYKRLKMYVHLEDGTSEQYLSDNRLKFGDITVILRMGADFENNYYEYEVPLAPSVWGVNTREAVWPELNNIDVALDEFTDVKLRRDAAGASKTAIYEQRVNNRVIRVKGSPNIATVKVLMVGLKNPKKGSLPGFDDDGRSKCAEVWVNELRVSDFNNSGGWATTASVKANLADLATMSLGANMSTPGFGSISQKLNERQQETRQSYDFSTNVELGKFTQDALSIPMYFRFSESWVKPRYLPLNPDIETEDLQNSDLFTQEEKDEILKANITYQNNRSINFTNVKVNNPKGKTKQHMYDIQNFSFTYSYNLDKFRDVQLEYENKRTHRGNILWAYNAKPKNYQPFQRAKWAKSPMMRLVKDFNFYLVPRQYSFSTTVDRGYNEKKLRQTNPFYDPRPYYRKRFNWDRTYGLRYDITRGLKFSYDASNNALIEETEGIVDRDDTSYGRWRETVMKSLREFGTNLRYQQNFTIDYSIPINKFPMTDWLNLSTSYNGGYYWDRAAIGSETYGNEIRNSSSLRWNSSWNLNRLYGKNDYLKRLEASGKGRNKGKIQKPKEKQKEGKKEPPKPPENSLKPAGKNDKKKDEKKKDDDKYRPLTALDYIAKLATGVKEISGTYTKSTGTTLPGYNQNNGMLGFSPGWSAPGAPFVVGRKQDTSFAINANNNGWLVKNNPDYRYNFTNTDGDNYTYRVNIRPINNMRIELNGAKNYSLNTNMGFTYFDTVELSTGSPVVYNNYLFENAIQTGSFSVSTLSYKTAFARDDRTNYNSSVFDKFNEFRPIASRKLAADRALRDTTYQGSLGVNNYYNEYGPTQQEVLISSFLAAYTGKSDVDIGPARDFRRLFPLPNWSITYDGIGKLKFLQKYFQSITVNHRYRSTFNVSSFTTNNLVIGENDSVLTNDIATGNYIPKYQISVVSITEMFSPFFDIDFNWKNGLLLGFEYKRDRNVSMSTVNNQITEVKGEEFIVSIGYTFRDIRITFTGNTKADPKDIVTRLDISSRENYTILRSIGEEVNSQPGSGQNVVSIKFTADLAMSPKFNIRGFYDRIVTNPFISNSFPTASSNYGISLRFSLAQ